MRALTAKPAKRIWRPSFHGGPAAHLRSQVPTPTPTTCNTTSTATTRTSAWTVGSTAPLSSPLQRHPVLTPSLARSFAVLQLRSEVSRAAHLRIRSKRERERRNMIPSPMAVMAAALLLSADRRRPRLPIEPRVIAAGKRRSHRPIRILQRYATSIESCTAVTTSRRGITVLIRSTTMTMAQNSRPLIQRLRPLLAADAINRPRLCAQERMLLPQLPNAARAETARVALEELCPAQRAMHQQSSR